MTLDDLTSSNTDTLEGNQMTVDNPSYDLLHIGNQVARTAKKIHEWVRDKKRPFSLSATKLLKDFPDLEVLGDMVLFQVREVAGSNRFTSDTLSLYKCDDVCGVYTPDLELADNFEIVRYKSGKRGFSVIRHESGLELTIAISYSEKHETDIERLQCDGLEDDGLEGEGTPPIDFLRELPNPEIPPSDNRVPNNVKITVVSSGKVSRKHKTPLLDVQFPDGEILKNLITNADLRRLHKFYGDGMKFMVTNKRQNKQGHTIVDIIDLEIDLSDLTP